MLDPILSQCCSKYHVVKLCSSSLIIALQVPNLVKIFFWKNFTMNLALFVNNAATSTYLDTLSTITKIYKFLKEGRNSLIKSIPNRLKSQTSIILVNSISSNSLAPVTTLKKLMSIFKNRRLVITWLKKFYCYSMFSKVSSVHCSMTKL